MGFFRFLAKGLRSVLQPPAITASVIDKTSKICSGSQINYSKIDKFSYVGHDSFVLNAEIGSFCSIADNCRIGGAEHDYQKISTSPVFYKGDNILKTNIAQLENKKNKPIVISSDVWIGANSIVKSGIKIGVGAVIGMGSVVTHDVPPYEIWAGNPARLIRKRFDDKIIEKLLEIKWWEWSDEKLKQYADRFDDPKKLIDDL